MSHIFLSLFFESYFLILTYGLGENFVVTTVISFSSSVGNNSIANRARKRIFSRESWFAEDFTSFIFVANWIEFLHFNFNATYVDLLQIHSSIFFQQMESPKIVLCQADLMNAWELRVASSNSDAHAHAATGLFQ